MYQRVKAYVEKYHMLAHLQYLQQEEHMTKLEIVYVIQN